MAERENEEEELSTDFEPAEAIPKKSNQLHTFRSSISNLFSTSKTSQYDPQTFRTALVHSAAFIFVLVCGLCALYAYRVLEPFLRSILWSILAGAFLFPFKKHFTSRARRSLYQLESDSYLLFYGLAIILPLKTLDRMIESIFPLCLRYWKELGSIVLFLPMIEFLQAGVVYHWFLQGGTSFLEKFLFLVHLFDSVWITTLIIGYLIAVLVFYNHSPLVKTILNLFAIPVWLILLIYLSQFLPVTYRLIVVILAISLTVVGFVVDLGEHMDPNPSRKWKRELSESLQGESVFRRGESSSSIDVYEHSRTFQTISID